MNEKQDGLIWEETGIKLRVVEQLRELAGQYGLSKLILFGSRARGDYRRESDIDLTASVGDVALFRWREEKTDMLLLRPGRSVISRYSMKDQIMRCCGEK